MPKFSSDFFTRACWLWLALAGANITWAQESKNQPADSLIIKPRSGLEVGFDYLKLGSFLTKFETKYEVQGGLLFRNKVRLAGEWGFGKIEPQRAVKNGTYVSEGTYYRLGADWIGTIDLKNSAYLGFRYGKSMFDDRATFTIESDLWNDFHGNLERTGLEADWYEVIIGTENNIWNNLFLGWIFRFRILNEYPGFEDFDVYTIPGYGRPINKTMPILNLYLKYVLSI